MASIKRWAEGTRHCLSVGIGLCSVEGKMLPVQERILLLGNLQGNSIVYLILTQKNSLKNKISNAMYDAENLE